MSKKSWHPHCHWVRRQRQYRIFVNREEITAWFCFWMEAVSIYLQGSCMQCILQKMYTTTSGTVPYLSGCATALAWCLLSDEQNKPHSGWTISYSKTMWWSVIKLTPTSSDFSNPLKLFHSVLWNGMYVCCPWHSCKHNLLFIMTGTDSTNHKIPHLCSRLPSPLEPY